MKQFFCLVHLGFKIKKFPQQPGFKQNSKILIFSNIFQIQQYPNSLRHVEPMLVGIKVFGCWIQVKVIPEAVM